MLQNQWQKYQNGNMPARDDIYLVLLNSAEGLALGFGANPPILTANFNTKTNTWVNYGSIIPIQNLEKIVIAWHEIPPL